MAGLQTRSFSLEKKKEWRGQPGHLPELASDFSRSLLIFRR